MDLPVKLTPSKGALLLDVFVQPRAARDAVAGEYRGALKVKTKAPPVDGKANRAVESLVADAFGIPRSAVSVVAGAASRSKRVAISGLDVRDARARLALVLSSPAHERRQGG